MPRTEGIAYWVDDDWRAAVVARLAELKWTQAELAKEARVKPNTISTLLNGETHTHTELPAIHKALGFPKPNPPLHTEKIRMLLELFTHAGSGDMELRMIDVLRAAMAVAKRGG